MQQSRVAATFGLHAKYRAIALATSCSFMHTVSCTIVRNRLGSDTNLGWRPARSNRVLPRLLRAYMLRWTVTMSSACQEQDCSLDASAYVKCYFVEKKESSDMYNGYPFLLEKKQMVLCACLTLHNLQTFNNNGRGTTTTVTNTGNTILGIVSLQDR